MDGGSRLVDFFANVAQGRATLWGSRGSTEGGGGDGEDHGGHVMLRPR